MSGQPLLPPRHAADSDAATVQGVVMSNIWHRAYCRWYDHDRAGHSARAAAWGFVADQIIRLGGSHV